MPTGDWRHLSHSLGNWCDCWPRRLQSATALLQFVEDAWSEKKKEVPKEDPADKKKGKGKAAEEVRRVLARR